MGNSQVMPKVDFDKENLKTAHIYSRFIEAKNIERYGFAKSRIRNRRRTFIFCVLLVSGIYSYTIYSIKQESFLDDFEEPTRINANQAMKHLSQNFLLQGRVIEKLVNSSGGVQDCEICEIGPGPGGITRSILANKAKSVLAIEKDKRFEPILEALQYASQRKLKVVYSDVMDYDLSNAFDKTLKKSWEDSPPKIHLIGNLPFNIADVLIFRWLKDISLRRNAWTYGRVLMTLTFQEEVAKRIVAQILSKFRSGISFMCQNWCAVTYKHTISGTAFLPKPKVNAGVVHFEPLVEPIVDLSYDLVEKVVRTVFNTRQKYCKHSIRNLFPKEIREQCLEEVLETTELEAEMRPFQIDNEEFARLCHVYNDICKRDPRIYKYNFRGPRLSREENWKIVEEVSQDDDGIS